MDGFVPQSPAEKLYFDYLWDIANNRVPGSDPNGGAGELSGAMAVQFFQRSSVDRGFLKQIWSLSTPSATMSLAQFYTALRFITMIQNGEIPISKERMQATLKENFMPPRFTGIDIPAAPKPVPISAPVPVPTAIPATGNVPGAAVVMPPFAMTPQEHIKYHSLFQSYDLNHDNLLSRDESVPIFQKSGLDAARVEQIVRMVDEDGDGLLTSKEFCAAFHVIVCVTKRNHTMPPSLPPALHHFLLNAPTLPPAPAATTAGPSAVPLAAPATPVPVNNTSSTTMTFDHTGSTNNAPGAVSDFGSSAAGSVADFGAPVSAVPASVPVPVPAVVSVSDAFDSMLPPLTNTALTTTTMAPTMADTNNNGGSISSSDIVFDTTPAVVSNTTGNNSGKEADFSGFDAFEEVTPSFAAPALSVPAPVVAAAAAPATPAVSVSVTPSSITTAFGANTSTTNYAPTTTNAVNFSAAHTYTPSSSSSSSSSSSNGNNGADFEVVAAVEQVRSAAKQVLQVHDQSMDTSDRHYSSLTAIKQSLHVEKIALEASVGAAVTASESMQKKLDTVLQEIADLTQTLGHLRAKWQETVSGHSEIQTRLAEKEMERLQLQTEIDTLVSSLNTTNTTNPTNASNNSAIVSLQKQISQTSQTLLPALQQDIDYLQNVKRSLLTMTQKTQATQALEQQARDQQQKDLQQKEQLLQKELAAQQQQILKLTQEKQTLFAQITQLQQNSANATAVHVSHDASSHKSESHEQESNVESETSFGFDHAYPDKSDHFHPKKDDDEEEEESFSLLASTNPVKAAKKENDSEGEEEDAFGYAAFSDTNNTATNATVFEAGFGDSNSNSSVDPFAATPVDTTTKVEFAETGGDNEEDPFAGFDNGDDAEPTNNTNTAEATHSSATKKEEDDVFGSSSATTDDVFGATPAFEDLNAGSGSNTDAFGSGVEDDVFGSAPSAFDDTATTNAFEASSTGNTVDAFGSDGDGFGSAPAFDDFDTTPPNVASNSNVSSSKDAFGYAGAEEDVFGSSSAFEDSVVATVAGPAEDAFGATSTASDDPFAASTAGETADFGGFGDDNTGSSKKEEDLFAATSSAVSAAEDPFFASPASPTTPKNPTAEENNATTASDGFDDFDAFGSDNTVSSAADPFAFDVSSLTNNTTTVNTSESDPFFAPSTPSTNNVNPAVVAEEDAFGSGAASATEEDPFASFD